MPYIIAVLFLVVIGTGFTLFQSNNVNEETKTIDAIVEELKETASSTFTTVEEGMEIEAEEPTEVTQEEPTPQVADTTPPKQQPKPGTTPAPTPTPTPAPSAPASTYTNGTYRTSSTYRTPDGTYTMDVSITVANDKITNSTLSFDSNGARDGYSKRFSSAYQSNVIGKDLETVSLSRVGGASLTTRAFNSALSSIRSQAS
jgi:outer membrane biosynthesis protein TonB